MSQLYRVFTIASNTPHVICMNCGAAMLANIKKNIPFERSSLIPTVEYEDVEVFIKNPFAYDFMRTYAHYGYVVECPFCALQHEENMKNILAGMHISLSA